MKTMYHGIIPLKKIQLTILLQIFLNNLRTKDLSLCRGGFYNHTIHGHKVRRRFGTIICGSHKSCAGFEPTARRQRQGDHLSRQTIRATCRVGNSCLIYNIQIYYKSISHGQNRQTCLSNIESNFCPELCYATSELRFKPVECL